MKRRALVLGLLAMALVSCRRPNRRGPPPPAGTYEGFLDIVSCESIRGWVWDAGRPDSPLNVELLDGERVLAVVPAATFRADLRAARKGDGRHAFIVPVPAALKDGRTRAIGARVAGSTFLLKSSPRQLRCGP